jgi:hypothetical protein
MSRRAVLGLALAPLGVLPGCRVVGTVLSSVDPPLAAEAGAAGVSDGNIEPPAQSTEDGAGDRGPDAGPPLDAQLDGDAESVVGDASDGGDSSDSSDESTCGVCTGGICQNGQCACPPGLLLCGGACVDEQTDNANCGACGVECSACTAGQCVIYLAREAFGGAAFISPEALAVDGTSVYWTMNGMGEGAVMTVPTTGGSPTPLAPYTLAGPAGIGVDATSVYWVDTWTSSEYSDAGPSGTVMKVSTAGGPAITLQSGQDTPCAIAVDATSVYWMNGCNTPNSGSLLKAPTTGGTPTTLASGQTFPVDMISGNPYFAVVPIGFAVDATSVYWTTSDSVMTVGKDGGPVTALASAQNFNSSALPGNVALAMDDTNVYWTTVDSVMTVAKSGGAATALASGQNTTGGIAVDATTVYWLSAGDAPVMKVSKHGGTPTALGSGLCAGQISSVSGCGPGGGILAVDATSVYWATFTYYYDTTSYAITKLTPK